jgi:hypothetical protein
MPANIGVMTRLCALNLENNRLTSFPLSIYKCGYVTPLAQIF